MRWFSLAYRSIEERTLELIPRLFNILGWGAGTSNNKYYSTILKATREKITSALKGTTYQINQQQQKVGSQIDGVINELTELIEQIQITQLAIPVYMLKTQDTTTHQLLQILEEEARTSPDSQSFHYFIRNVDHALGRMALQLEGEAPGKTLNDSP